MDDREGNERGPLDDAVRDPESAKRREGFIPDVLDSSVIAFPLMDRLKNEPRRLHHVVIDLNLHYPGGRDKARADVKDWIADAWTSKTPPKVSDDAASQYVFATLDAETIKAIVRKDREASDDVSQRAIFHVWPDFEIRALS